ncbi:FecR family protein [Hymenobacter jejuensis]|uniref:DUF4974 domain-containing protein n=1 Tax=Hymenobacter jejuensis TaxID=2502781 RepID=A0A5B7ZXV2_9BACT|nr:FecR domain-containing protein [Hymenobacter jejuensis]QDA59687.1 DUF4974 domain-containing protein [Hymenobacter jejuensis]
MSALPADTEVPWDLLAKHLAGEATATEQEQLRMWVAARPERLGLLTDATRAWERVGAAPVADLFSDAEVEAAWQRFRPQMLAKLVPDDGLQVFDNQIDKKEHLPSKTKIVPINRPSTQSWLRIAAALALLIGATLLFRMYSGKSRSGAEPVAVRTGAQKRLVALPDGSKVWLNHHSTLQYAADFSRGPREVHLVGEAFFEVRKDHGRPFTVLSATSRTQVLGTSFNVRAYKAEDSVEVAVVTGRVAFASLAQQRDTVLLTPGKRGILYAANGTAPVRATPRRTVVQDTNFRAWQNDELVFENARLSHVLRTLRTTFGTKITVADPRLLEYRFTGTFHSPAPAQVLQVVGAATNAQLTGDAASGYELRPE